MHAQVEMTMGDELGCCMVSQQQQQQSRQHFFFPPPPSPTRFSSYLFNTLP